MQKDTNITEMLMNNFGMSARLQHYRDGRTEPRRFASMKGVVKMRCPIAWTQRDGPFPCAFLQKRSECTRTDVRHPCIPVHQEKYNHAVKTTTVHCAGCNCEMSTTNGVLERCGTTITFEFLCGACSDYESTRN